MTELVKIGETINDGVVEPLYCNPSNVIWIEGNKYGGCKIFFNTSRGSAGTACIGICDVTVEDMKEILEGKETYENVRKDDEGMKEYIKSHKQVIESEPSQMENK